MSRRHTVAELNDAFRSTFQSGPVILSEGVASPVEGDRNEIIAMVNQFSEFTENNDDDGLHNFGVCEHAHVGKVLWRIDCYDRDYRDTSGDPADPDITRRVLTIMLEEEEQLSHEISPMNSRFHVSRIPMNQNNRLSSVILKFRRWVASGSKFDE